jgi:hydrogenase-4 membrane subunit HyfE
MHVNYTHFTPEMVETGLVTNTIAAVLVVAVLVAAVAFFWRRG